MNQRTRKHTAIRKALYPTDDINGLYVSRKEEGRGYAKFVDGFYTLIRRLKDYIKRAKKQPETMQATQLSTEHQ